MIFREHAVRASLVVCLGLAGSSGCGATTTSIGAWLPDGSTTVDATTEPPPEAGTGLYLEAEEGELSGGFLVGSDPIASGAKYLEPPSGVSSTSEPGGARARYTFAIPTSGTYAIWGRIRSPDASHNTFWFQIDGAPWFVWRMTTGEIWHFAKLHENANYGSPLSFDLATGTHEMIVANSVANNALDRFYFSADDDTPPGNDTACNPPHTIQTGGACIPSCGSQRGNACGVQACQGRPIIPAYDCDVCCRTP